MEELIQRILSEGVKEVITSEPVLGGLTRPLSIRYTSSEGTVIETWEYANDPMDRAWGAIKGMSQSLANDQDPELIAVINDRRFGNDLINQYLKENKALDLTTAQSLQQLQKFAGAKALLEAGALGAARDVISAVEADEIFTQERKDKYVNALS